MTRLARQLASERCRFRLLAFSLLMAASGCNSLLGNESVSGDDGSQGDAMTATSNTTGDEPSGGTRASDGSSGHAAIGGNGSTGVKGGAGGTDGTTSAPDAGGAGGAGGANDASGGMGGTAAAGGGGGSSTPPTCAALSCPEHSSCDDSAPACVCLGGYELHSGVCLDADECADHSAACDPNAACLNQDGGYSCVCMAPYIGDGMRCTLDTTCQAQQCGANASCDSGGCVCISGFQGDGKTCTRIDPCKSTPCKNAGACSATATGYSCDCASTGFMGTTCQEPVDDCASKPCKNGGTCTDKVNDYACACTSGWTGKQCDQSSGCDYGGAHHASGTTFPASDGCNTCSCGATGTAVCTTQVCAGQTCGGITGAKCPSGQYCNFANGCGANDQQGTCAAPPSVCNDAVISVCGCDGKTYPNACYAARSQQSVATTGECTPTPTGCTYDGTPRDSGSSFPSTDGCNTCTCSANGAVACTQKACTTGCGGKLGTSCSNGQYCSFPVGACGANDITGTCTTKPDLCPDVVQEVCGCDNKTYSNACRASSSGVSISSSDACVPP